MSNELLLQIATLFGFFAGGLACAFAVYFAWRYARLLDARTEAKSIVAEAQRTAKDINENSQEQVEAATKQLKHRNEKDLRKIEHNIQKLTKQVSLKESQLQQKLNEKEAITSEHQSIVDKYENQVNEIESRLASLQNQKQDLQKNYTQSLLDKSGLEAGSVKRELIEHLIEDFQSDINRITQNEDDQVIARAEKEARRLINLALNRFVRPYCAERGIGYLNFSSDPSKVEEQKERVMGPEQSRLKWVEKHCGVDLVYDEPNNSINVYGFDPVRRELGRATVERMLTDRQVWDEKRVEEMVSRIKKDLFRRIMEDGKRIAKELGADDMHTEIKNVMGALRYRYSFTQNQYYHCAEVGFLCGLLAAELGVPISDARRSGLLHDLGKSMDHTTDGGHAVIGADFIQKHGEKDDIVHAVRAHHFDVQPNSDMAYLVIAADALSGARPGARRSTAQSYTQKIQDLQQIAQQFPGVMDTHIVNAGREVRVFVDSQKMDDAKAMGLSKTIAEKIESEMAYPGQIKITIVRRTQAVDYAR